MMLTHQSKSGPDGNVAARALFKQADLLQTKLRAPLSRSNSISRRLLIERLNENRNARLILVTAPAGFGKTTLLVEWLAQMPGSRAVWVSLEEAENDFERFWRYVLAALQEVDSSFGARLANYPDPVGAWPGLLAADLEQCGDPLHLVLDDYHVIHNAAVHQSLNHLWQHLPPHAHLVIASRADPPLPLARLRVRDELFELRAADLQFTEAETGAYLNQVMKLELSADDVGRLARRTEGWPAGLYLVARLLLDRDRAERHHFIATFSGSNHLILNYLLEEVLQQQPPDVRDFLLRTSILNRLSDPLCAAVTEQPLDVAAQTLTRLAQDNLFVIPLDDEGRWFRYHSLFAESLALRLRESAPQLWDEIHRKAYAWCARNGYTERAISHALAGHDFEGAAALIEAAGDRIWTAGDPAVPLHWLDALPRSLIEQRPALRLLYAWLLFLHDRWPEVTPLWEETGAMLVAQPPGGNAYRGHWAAIGGAMYAHHLQPEETTRLSELALTLLPPEDHVWRAVSRINLGLAYQAQGHTGRAASQYKGILDDCITRGDLYLVFVTLAHLIEACFAQGRLYEAQEYSERLRELEALPGGRTLALQANADVDLGRLAYERNDLPTAERLLAPAVDHLWPGGQPRMVLAARLALVQLYNTRGDDASVRDHLSLAQEMVTRLRMTAEENLVRAYVARQALREQRWDDVRGWQEASGLSYRDLPDFRREFEHMVLAEVLIAEGRYEQAESLLARLRNAAERAGRLGSDLVLSLFSVLALTHQKRETEAEAMARYALGLAQPQGYVRTLLDFGPPLLHVLMRPTVRRVCPDYVDRLCRAFQAESQPPPRRPAPGERHQNGHHLTPDIARGSLLLEPMLAEKLTPREWEILAMIAGGASNQEIADDLILSVGTVKGHVNHIFGKLDVHNRTAAVARARDYGLIKN